MMRLVMTEGNESYQHDLVCINTLNSGVKMGLTTKTRQSLLRVCNGTKNQNETEGYMIFLLPSMS